MRIRYLVLAMVVFGACSRPNGAFDDGGGGGVLAPGDAGVPDLARAPDGAPGAGGNGAPNDYGSDGPAPVQMTTAMVPHTGGSFGVTLFVPGTPGPHPVVVLSSGLLQTAAGYAPYGHRLASWGMIAILRDDPGLGAQTSDVAAELAMLVSGWLPSQNADPQSALHGAIDVARVGLAGHSRGGQIALLAAEGELHGKLKGVFGLDPVDGMQGGANARASIGALGIPVAFLGETTDSGAAGGGMACAPAADNYEVLYAAASSPAVALTAVGADHTQFEDPANCTLCTLCTPGSTDGKTVLALSMKYLTAFFARELLSDANVGAAFQGAGAATDVATGRILLKSK
jgi:dienelactone hydrolase